MGLEVIINVKYTIHDVTPVIITFPDPKNQNPHEEFQSYFLRAGGTIEVGHMACGDRAGMKGGARSLIIISLA